MTESLLVKLNNLKDEISKDDRVIFLNHLEDRINNEDDVLKLAYDKDMKAMAYEDSLKHFGENSIEAMNAQKALYESKKKLDMHPSVVQYNEAYKKVKEMYNQINEVLFRPFINKR
ncbi:MAG: YlbF family regulator [Bacilli bacterium]|nr:YlbF family regulator [Bacilli bacterium]